MRVNIERENVDGHAAAAAAATTATVLMLLV